MTAEEMIARLAALEDRSAEVWLQDPQTARCYPVDVITEVAMLSGWEITEDPIDHDYLYPAVLLGSGG